MHGTEDSMSEWMMHLQVPPSTLLVWLSPHPRDMAKGLPKPELPAAWLHVYARMAADLGFFYPTGPVHHLDLYSLALGKQCTAGQLCKVTQLPFKCSQTHTCSIKKHPLPNCPAADCLPWCMLSDGAHVNDTVNELVLQILVNLCMQLGVPPIP